MVRGGGGSDREEGEKVVKRCGLVHYVKTQEPSLHCKD